jgi:hypothetical protein
MDDASEPVGRDGHDDHGGHVDRSCRSRFDRAAQAHRCLTERPEKENESMKMSRL